MGFDQTMNDILNLRVLSLDTANFLAQSWWKEDKGNVLGRTNVITQTEDQREEVMERRAEWAGLDL